MAHENQRLLLLMAVAVAAATYLLNAIWSLDWRNPPVPMQWLPFASSLSNSVQVVVTSVAFDSLCFGAIIWAAVRMGGNLIGIAVATATMVLVCEWLQCYLPTFGSF